MELYRRQYLEVLVDQKDGVARKLEDGVLAE